MLYIRRDHWLRPVSVVLGIAAVVWVGWLLLVALPNAQARDALPDQLESRVAELLSETDDAAARAQAEAFATAGRQALRDGDTAAAADALDDLDDLSRQLSQAFEVRIVSRPNELSGAWRVPDANPNARNFYLIVEAVDAGGDRLQVPIVSEENNGRRWVDAWGVRVSESTFQRVAADKRDDGIIQTNIVGRKRAGELAPDYLIDTPGGAITEW